MPRSTIWLAAALVFGMKVAWHAQPAASAAGEVAAEGPAEVATKAPFQPLLVVRTMPRAKLLTQPPATVRGVVIRSTPRAVVIQDPTGGLYVNVSRAITRGWLPGPLTPEAAPFGHEVEIEGVLEQGGFAPIIVPRSIAVLGRKPLPEPRRKDPGVLLAGGYDSEFVEFTGIVQSVRRQPDSWALAVNCRGQDVFVAIAPDAVAFDVTRLLDAEVRFRGVAAAMFTPRGEFRSAVVYVEQPGWVDMIEPSPRKVLLKEAIPLQDVGRFRSAGDTGHLLRTGGTVVHAVPGEAIYLQEGAWGLRVETESGDVFQPGERVEVIGFLDRRLPAAGLRHAEIRRIAAGEPPEPFAITPEAILAANRRAAEAFVVADPGDYQGCLVRFPARLMRIRGDAGQRELVLDAAGGTVLARLRDFPDASLGRLLPDSEIDISGLVELAWDPDRQLRAADYPQRVSLLVRSPADIVVTRPPSAWTPARLAWLLGAAIVALGLLGIWATLLGRRRERLETMVMERTAELAEARAREKRREEQQRELLEQKLKTSLAASAVAHEINQPLSRLLLKCRLEADRDESHSEFIDAVVTDAERVVTTIEKMKVLLRNVETSHAPVDLGAVVNSALHQVKRQLAHHGIAVRRTGPMSGCIVRGDDVQLQFAVTNLLRNAAEAIAASKSDRREIEVEIRDHRGGRPGDPDGAAAIIVGDSGPGWPGGSIDEALLASSKPEGTGIGLFVVKTAVANHEGMVTVGRSPLGGAEFRITLPHAQGGHEAEAARS